MMLNLNTKAITAGAISGLVAALVVDLHTFRAWKSIDDAKAFNWTLALQRWIMGAVSGALAVLTGANVASA